MEYKIISCQNDDEYEQFARFFLEHRGEFLYPYSVKAAVHYISVSLRQGNILLAFNDREEAIGMLVFSLGTPDKDYEDKHIAYISFLLIRKDYRRSMLFMEGLKRVIEAVGQTGAEEVRFKVNADNAYLRKLYGKFATVVSQKKNDNYGEDIYSIKYSDFVRFVTNIAKRDNLFSKPSQ